MLQIAQPPKRETAQERQQRRDALLRYGHIYSEAHRRSEPSRTVRDEALKNEEEEGAD